MTKRLDVLVELSQNIHNLLNEESTELVEMEGLTKNQSTKLQTKMSERYPGKYDSEISMEIKDKKETYTLSVKKRY